MCDTDISALGVTFENEQWVDTEMDKILIEIDTEENDAPTFKCTDCSCYFNTKRGLSTHSRIHKRKDNLEKNDLLIDIDKAIEKCKVYVKNFSCITFSEDLIHFIIETYVSNLQKPAFSREFIKIFRNFEITILQRTVLVELLEILLTRKSCKTTENAVLPHILNDNEREITYYVCGRVIRTLYFQTKNQIYWLLKGEYSGEASEKNLWGLTSFCKNIVDSLESKVQIYLQSKIELDALYISNEVFTEMEDQIDHWIFNNRNHLESCDSYSHFLKKFMAKYIRTRGHSFASRFSKLYDIQTIKKRKSNGKGKKGSFRNNLKKNNT